MTKICLSVRLLLSVESDESSVHACPDCVQVEVVRSHKPRGGIRGGCARLGGQLLVDGGLIAGEESGLARLQVNGDGNVVGVVHRPALD